jgi:hypothetical protein
MRRKLRGRARLTNNATRFIRPPRKNYYEKMLVPYEIALPDLGKAGGHPPVFLIPGNHDWYDGLVIVLAKFCRKKPTPVGNWRTQQRRSYFAVHLTERWWLWAIDIALTRDMDQPQADYSASRLKPVKEIELHSSRMSRSRSMPERWSPSRMRYRKRRSRKRINLPADHTPGLEGRWEQSSR